MTDAFKIPDLIWKDSTEPTPMQQLEMQRELDAELTQEGIIPTDEQRHEAFVDRLGTLTVEVSEDQRRDAVQQAIRMRQELTEFIETYGGHDE